MRPNSTKVSVFVASPSDVHEERRRIDNVQDEINEVLAHAGVFLDVQKWETRVGPDVADRVEDAILAQIEPYEVFIGIMWHRLGTDTGRAASGTVEEFNIAHDLWTVH